MTMKEMQHNHKNMLNDQTQTTKYRPEKTVKRQNKMLQNDSKVRAATCIVCVSESHWTFIGLPNEGHVGSLLDVSAQRPVETFLPVIVYKTGRWRRKRK